MLKARSFTAAGESRDAFELPGDLFDGVVHEEVLHQVVKAHLANRRQGTAATKTRGMVSGGGKKVWRQKGTGRARQGSIRAPHWRGGGVVFGPTPRNYRQDIPKKVKALARRSALNTRALREEISVIEGWNLDAPKTARIVEILNKMGIDGRKVLILTEDREQTLYLSVRNLPNVQVAPFSEASTYDILNANELVIEAGALGGATREAAEEMAHA